MKQEKETVTAQQKADRASFIYLVEQNRNRRDRGKTGGVGKLTGICGHQSDGRFVHIVVSPTPEGFRGLVGQGTDSILHVVHLYGELRRDVDALVQSRGLWRLK